MPGVCATSQCPPDEVLFALASGERDVANGALVPAGSRVHLAKCDACRELVVALTVALRDEGTAPAARGHDLASASTELQPEYASSEATRDTTATALERFAPGTTLLGMYTVISVLGRGGMGIVLRASCATLEPTEAQRDVAIKVLYGAASRSAEMRVRLVREAAILRELASPHVATPTTTGTLATGEPYLVMDWLEGEDLAKYLARTPAVPLALAIEWTMQICAALAAAHQRGIVHRDLKPSNVFLHIQPCAEPQIKLLDFGLSKRVAAPPCDGDQSSQNAVDDLSLTKAHTLLGTPAYMAPEQVLNAREVGPSADVWSVGVLFCELVSGTNPFAQPSLGGTLAAVLTAPCPVLAVPTQVQELIATCLAKVPAKRFADASALLRALDKVGRVQVRPLRDARTRTRVGAGALALMVLGSAALTWRQPRTRGVQSLAFVVGAAQSPTAPADVPAPQVLTPAAVAPVLHVDAPRAFAFGLSTSAMPGSRPAKGVQTVLRSAAADAASDDTAIVFGARQ